MFKVEGLEDGLYQVDFLVEFQEENLLNNPGETDSIGVFVYGPKARYKEILDIKSACTADGIGAAQCHGEPARKKPKTSDDRGEASASTSQTSEQSRCGNTCIRQADCDNKNNCICASPENTPPIDATWGRYTCQFVPNAAAAITAAASVIKTSQCRGRCLLGVNGTFEIPSNTTAEPIAAPAPFITNQLAGILEESKVCPCNCTYVSHACCLSPDGIVFEDRGQKVHTAIQPPNGTVCCDGATGNWTQAPVQRDTPPKDPMCPQLAEGQTGAQIHF